VNLYLTVSGTREIDERVEACVLYQVTIGVPMFFQAHPRTIRVGDARGVDDVVRRNFACTVYQAQWDLVGRRAGMLRNEAMIDDMIRDRDADLVRGVPALAVLLAFPRSTGRGTQGAIAYALRRGIHVCEHPVESAFWSATATHSATFRSVKRDLPQ
jgi:hypothetical protein